jgi:integrase/recombinase XerD
VSASDSRSGARHVDPSRGGPKVFEGLLEILNDFLAFCSVRQLELENVKAYHVGAWLDQHPGSRSTQRQHLAAVRLLFDSLMMRGVVEYNPAARAKPPRLVRESSHTPVFEEAEIVAFLDSINLESLKDIRDKAIFSVLFCSWCRVSALINLTVADYYERGGTRWLRFQEKRGKEHEVPVGRASGF